MVCGDNYFSIQFNILHLAILLALVQTGEGLGDLYISKVMVTQSANFLGNIFLKQFSFGSFKHRYLDQIAFNL